MILSLTGTESSIIYLLASIRTKPELLSPDKMESLLGCLNGKVLLIAKSILNRNDGVSLEMQSLAKDYCDAIDKFNISR